MYGIGPNSNARLLFKLLPNCGQRLCPRTDQKVSWLGLARQNIEARRPMEAKGGWPQDGGCPEQLIASQIVGRVPSGGSVEPSDCPSLAPADENNLSNGEVR